MILLRERRRVTLEELFKARANVVREAGLVVAFVRHGVPYEEEVYLTPVGRTVAEKLKEIEDLVGWAGRGTYILILDAFS